jgi:hypothetical protein
VSSFINSVSSPPIPTPGVYSLANQYQAVYNAAYYASKPPQFQPLYYGRPGVIVPPGLGPLKVVDFEALINSLVANPPTNPVTGLPTYIIEQIEYWGWDPYTTNLIASQYGLTYFPPGKGDVVSAEVITPGEYSGPVPVGYNSVIVDIKLLVPYPASGAPLPPPTTVGPQWIGPYYEILGPIPPLNTLDSTGKYKVVSIPRVDMFGSGVPAYYWELISQA